MKKEMLLSKFKNILVIFLTEKLPKILLIFAIGFTTRFIINYYLGVNVFVDYMSSISILYYLNFSWMIVYFNSIDFNINKFKFIVNRDSITYDYILCVIRCMIDGIIHSNDRNKITMTWEGSLFPNHPSNTFLSAMTPEELAAIPGSSPSLLDGGPRIRPDDTYDIPPTTYIPGDNNKKNQPFGFLMSKALEDIAVRHDRVNVDGSAGTIQWLDKYFDRDGRKFFEDFMKHKHPNKTFNQWDNSPRIRKELREL